MDEKSGVIGIGSYRLLTDAYYGIGLFEAGAGLQQYQRESPENLLLRRSLAYYLNYTGPIVNASVDPIYKDEIKRDWNPSPFFEAFLQDCDRSGTPYQDFCKNAALHAKLYGAVYVIVDNSDIQDETRDAALQNRHIPFLKCVFPEQIKKWKVDAFGRISYFQYEEHLRAKEYEDITRRCTWTTDSWTIEEDGQPVRSGEHGLGRVPVVQWLSRNTPKTMILPPSEFLSIAQANYFLYQLCSWHTQILRDQAFSILIMPDIGDKDITIGTNNVLTFPPDASHTPAFIAPAAGPAQMLTDQMDRIIKEMFRMSGLDSVVGVQTDTSKSGVAKQWEFEKTNKRLADFAVRCEQADKAIVDLYEAWAGESVGYTCEYPRDFSIRDVQAGLEEAKAALDLGFASDTYTEEVLKKVLEAYLPNIENEVYDKIIEEVEKAGRDRTMGIAYGNGGIDGGTPINAANEDTGDDTAV